jgi:hypothetical protein
MVHMPMKSTSVPTPLASVAVLALLVATVVAADVSGTWALEFQRNGSDALYQSQCSFDQQGTRLSGSCRSGFESVLPVSGTAEDASVSFEFSTGVDSGTTVTFSGRLDAQGASITGTWRFVDGEGNKGEGTFTAMKQ